MGIGYVPEDRRVFPDLTVKENLEVMPQRNVSKQEGWSVEKIFHLFPGLDKLQKSKGMELSGGEQQMLTIARTLMDNPEILLLDEPSEGLAPLIVKELEKLIRRIKDTQRFYWWTRIQDSRPNFLTGLISSRRERSTSTTEDDDDTQIVTPTPVIDVSLDKQVSNSTPNVGSNVTFTLVIANAGPSTATNVVVTDIVPSGYTYVGASIAGGDSRTDANPSSTGLTWTINSLASGASVNLTYQAMVLASGTYDNYAEITSHTQTDSDSTPNNGSTTEDDDDTLTVTPSPRIDLSIAKTASSTTPAVGSAVTFTLTVANGGPSTATNIGVTDVVPEESQIAEMTDTLRAVLAQAG